MVSPELHESVQEGPDAFIVLAAAARAIHGERDVRRLLAWVADASRQVTGAAAAGVWLGDDPGWVSSGMAAADPALLGDPRECVALGAVFDSQAVAVETITTSSDPRLRRLLTESAVLAVPIVIVDDVVAGTLVLTFRGSDELNPRAGEVAAALAAHLGVALENLDALERLAELEASQRSAVRQLQEAVLTPDPAVPLTELGMHYVAADESAPTGGDLHDWVLLPDGQLHLVVVDIMGKGVAATKDALAVTHALRLLVFDGCPLDALVKRADELVCSQNPDIVATVVIARYDPETGQLRIAGGGHPPPLVVSKGAVREIVAPGIPIGWPGAGSFEVAETTLDRSDTLILYTDGLVETTKNIDEGIERLGQFALETARYPARNMARALVERALSGVTRHDDSLALVLRRRTPPIQPGRHLLRPFSHRFTPNPAGVSLARHLLADWLIRLPLEGPEADDLLLIASELCNNAVRHATGTPAGVALRAWVEDQDLVVEVEDDGGGMSWPERLDELPDPEAENGRGLFLVNALSDQVIPHNVPGHNIIRALKRAVIGAADTPSSG